jgi:hypothetical protein
VRDPGLPRFPINGFDDRAIRHPAPGGTDSLLDGGQAGAAIAGLLNENGFLDPVRPRDRRMGIVRPSRQSAGGDQPAAVLDATIGIPLANPIERYEWPQ